MSKIFSEILGNKPKLNSFDLSHERKFTAKMGTLYPIMCEEVVPGDVFKCNSEVMLRMMPMIAPVMHRVDVYSHFFFVPNRLVWDNWGKFISGEKINGNDPVHPYIRATLVNDNILGVKGQLFDFLGIQKGNYQANAIPLRGYQLIYNEYYRDQNLKNQINVYKLDGDTAIPSHSDFMLQKRAWEKDYFTSALPWAQKGGEVELPLGGSAPVTASTSGISGNTYLRNALTGAITTHFGAVNVANDGSIQDSNNDQAYYDPNGSLTADLSGATAATINELRKATALQKWLERQARSGSRYIETILSHFGVQTEDYRLQRPEYLGGGKSPIVISEVLQTSQVTSQPSALGTMAGHGISVGNSHTFTKKFTEHGFVFCIFSVMPKTSYNGLTRRHYFKADKFDYYWPEFAQLGEQPVYVKELYPSVADKSKVFGYQQRYCEYKYIPSTVNGEMKDTLSFWHFGRKFANEPALNGTFIEPQTAELAIPFAVQTDTDNLVVQVFHNLRALRPIPFYNVPQL